MQTHPVPSFGPFRIVQLSHLRRVELTQEQRLSQAKQAARQRSWQDVHDDQFDKVADRRFTGEAMTDHGAL